MAEKFWNVVAVQGNRQSVAELRKFISRPGSASVFDFDVFVSVPSCLDIPYSPTVFLSYYAYKAVIDRYSYDRYVFWGRFLYRVYIKERETLGRSVTDFASFVRYCERFKRYGISLAKGKQVYDNVRKYGVGTAVEWMQREWGVLSNSFDSEEISDSKFAFAVNGDVPDRMFLHLSKKFPDVTLVCRYAGDFPGKRCGILEYFGGRLRKMDEYTEPESGSADSSSFEVLFWKSVMGCHGVRCNTDN